MIQDTQCTVGLEGFRARPRRPGSLDFGVWCLHCWHCQDVCLRYKVRVGTGILPQKTRSTAVIRLSLIAARRLAFLPVCPESDTHSFVNLQLEGVAAKAPKDNAVCRKRSAENKLLAQLAVGETQSELKASGLRGLFFGCTCGAAWGVDQGAWLPDLSLWGLLLRALGR